MKQLRATPRQMNIKFPPSRGSELTPHAPPRRPEVLRDLALVRGAAVAIGGIDTHPHSFCRSRFDAGVAKRSNAGSLLRRDDANEAGVHKRIPNFQSSAQ